MRLSLKELGSWPGYLRSPCRIPVPYLKAGLRGLRKAHASAGRFAGRLAVNSRERVIFAAVGRAYSS